MRHSPCVGICKLDDKTGFCLGCGRTGAEIGGWMSMGEPERDAVWRRLPERLASLAVRVRLLPWTRDELIDWVRDTIEARKGSWVTGVPGAVAEFPCKPGTDIDVEVHSNDIVARATAALFRLRINDKTRAFAFASGGPIVLGLPKARAALRSSAVVAALGPDHDAIDEARKTEELFDIGIGRASARFCVRTGDASLISLLTGQVGRQWPEMMGAAGSEIIAASPCRVVETAAARIEVFAQIPPPGGVSPAGAHTHLLADVLMTGEDTPNGLALPEYALPVAIFYPGGTGK